MRWLIVGLAGTAVFMSAAGSADLRAAGKTGSDWPQWRGPNRDGISPEKKIASRWDKDGPELLWKAEGLGRGYAGVAIANGKAYSIGRRGRAEQIMCLNLEDQRELWATNVGSGDHSNSTPTVDGNRVYAVALSGDLACLDAESGELLWKKNYAQDFGGRMMSGWGFSESPLVDGEKLLCTPGGRDAMVVALDKENGSEIWRAAMPRDVGPNGGDGAGYASIVVSEGAGVRQYVTLVGRGVIGVDAKSGQVLWTYNKIANGTANIPTPIVKDDFVFCSNGYDAGSALLKLKKSGRSVVAEEVYFLRGNVVQNHHGGMVLVGKHVYLGNKHNQGFPLCLELATGKVAWDAGRGPGQGSAAVVAVDGKLLFRYENGVMAMIDANPRKYTLLGTFDIASKISQSWPHPAVADGKLYLRDQNVLLCYSLK